MRKLRFTMQDLDMSTSDPVCDGMYLQLWLQLIQLTATEVDA